MVNKPATVRTLQLVILGLLLVGAILVAMILIGTFDPKPLGLHRTVIEPGMHKITATGEELYPQSGFSCPAAPPTPYTVRLTAAHTGGERDSGYGLTLGDGTPGFTAAVSPLGYVAVWEDGENGRQFFIPWQTWPHVRTGDTSNEIWVDVEQTGARTRMTVRLNRELLWQGETAASACETNLWLGTFGGLARVDFQQLEWFDNETR